MTNDCEGTPVQRPTIIMSCADRALCGPKKKENQRLENASNMSDANERKRQPRVLALATGSSDRSCATSVPLCAKIGPIRIIPLQIIHSDKYPTCRLSSIFDRNLSAAYGVPQSE